MRSITTPCVRIGGRCRSRAATLAMASASAGSDLPCCRNRLRSRAVRFAGPRRPLLPTSRWPQQGMLRTPPILRCRISSHGLVVSPRRPALGAVRSGLEDACRVGSTQLIDEAHRETILVAINAGDHLHLPLRGVARCRPAVRNHASSAVHAPIKRHR